jgi:hypothetical protein
MGRTKNIFIQEQEYIVYNQLSQPQQIYKLERTMKDLNDVWEHLLSQQITGKCTTTYSQFYIMNGYKIERMNDGDVVVYNTRGNAELYRKIGPREELTLVRHGFLKGTHMLSIDYLEIRLDDLNDAIRHYLDTGKDELLEKSRTRRKNVIKKIRNHYSKIK